MAMGTIFLWANILICAFLTASVWHSCKRGLQGARQLLMFSWSWQFVAALIVLFVHVSPWHLIWCYPLSFTAASAMRHKLTAPSLESAAEELDLEDRKDFIAFVESQPALRKFFADQSFDAPQSPPPGPHRRLRLSIDLCLLSENFKDAGNLLYALQTLRWSLKFEPFNRTAWMGFAELDLLLDDRRAARWASKVLSWKPDDNTSTLMQKLYESIQESAPSGYIQNQESRMCEIIRICAQNPNWHDSYDWNIPYGL